MPSSQPTDYFIDYAQSAEGDGSLANPFKTIQYAVDNITRNSTDGNRLNLHSATEHQISATISLTTYGSPSWSAPLSVCGYTTSAADGSRATINCNGFTFMSQNYMAFDKLNIHNVNNTQTRALTGTACAITDCYFYDIDTTAIKASNPWMIVVGCRFEDISQYGIWADYTSRGNNIIGNYFKNGTKSFQRAIYHRGQDAIIADNIISLSGSSTGIYCLGPPIHIKNNSIIGNGSTGDGITIYRGYLGTCVNNLVEGFNRGIYFADAYGEPNALIRNNSLYNNTTDITNETSAIFHDGNETLSESPFQKSGADTYDNRLNYFAPKDVGLIMSGSYHNEIRGAVRRAASSGTAPYNPFTPPYQFGGQI